MQKNTISNSLIENSIKNSSCFKPPAPLVNKSIVGGVSSSFNTYMSYKSFNLSKSPMKTNSKLVSEDFSQTNSYRNLSFPTCFDLQHNWSKCISTVCFTFCNICIKYSGCIRIIKITTTSHKII